MKGYLSLVLHAHLPYVRHPHDATVMEQRWLYEAIIECYMPLLRAFEQLVREATPFRLTLSLSAPLLHLLEDDLTKQRFTDHLDRLEELAQKELERTRGEPWYHRLAEMYAHHLAETRRIWDAHDGSLVSAFARYRDAGRLELMTSTATHAFFPLMNSNWSAMRAQVEIARSQYERVLGENPPGMWLGECGYVPGVEHLLHEAGVRHFFVDTHALLLARERPSYGVQAPIFCENGVAAFARDPETSELVWSADSGYPGDPHYRDFYRDVGFDLPMDYIGPYVHEEGHRMATGFKYYAITHGELHDKWVYDPDKAQARVREHAADFVDRIARRCAAFAPTMDRPPVVVSPYDAELYGHWWFEGPDFLMEVFRRMAARDDVEAITAGDYLDRHPRNQVTTPQLSSWGQNGYSSYWLNETNAWIYPHLHMAADRMIALAREHPHAEGPRARALNQAARELLLAQSSDWAFIMKSGTTVEYARRRIEEHIGRFNRIHDAFASGEALEQDWLEDVEQQDNIFPELDYRVYAN